MLAKMTDAFNPEMVWPNFDKSLHLLLLEVYT